MGAEYGDLIRYRRGCEELRNSEKKTRRFLMPSSSLFLPLSLLLCGLLAAALAALLSGARRHPRRRAAVLAQVLMVLGHTLQRALARDRRLWAE
eukprot:2227135-Prymnesium_polylepis.1